MENLTALYESFKARNLKLDMSRGKPSPTQLDISIKLMEAPACFRSADGIDSRNYGVLDGLPEMKNLFAELLGISPERIVVGGNSSLNMMYDAMARFHMFGVLGGKPWSQQKVKWLCPSPGYDRHFAVSAEFGYELIPVPMTPEGPDMDVIEEFCRSDDTIKGMWCVPLYSNPQGICCSDETVRRLGAMKAADDFRIFWDNAYAVHPVYERVPLADIFASCEAGGHPERAMEFFSTSKVTFPGAGVSMVACGPLTKAELLSHMTVQTIGADKINQLRVAGYFKRAADLHAHMDKMADELRPKFDVVLETLDRELGGTGLATWQKPKGGYFVAVETLPHCAKRTVELCAEAGVKLTSAGATWPHGVDPRDTSIRLAPSYPTVEELSVAMQLFCLCVKIAAKEREGMNA